MGIWEPKIWPDQIFPFVNFVVSHCDHFGLGVGRRGGGGGGCTPPPTPMVVGCSNVSLRPPPPPPKEFWAMACPMSHQQTSPPLHLQGAHVLHKGGGCAPHAGRCPPWGWQKGCDQPTAHGTANVIWRREIRVQGGRWVGQAWVRKRGTQEHQQTRGGATQTHRTREPHKKGRGRAQVTRERGVARQERQPRHGTRMEGMGECAHGRW